MYDRIRFYVRELMKGYNLTDKKMEREIVLACYDKYKKKLSDGVQAEEAYLASIADVANILKDKKVPESRFRYSLTFSICALVISIVEIIVAIFSTHPLEFFRFEMPIFILLMMGTLVFTFIKHRKFYWHDYVILAIFLLSWASALFQIGVYAYHATMPDRYWSAEYGFPCIIRILTFVTDSYPNVFYQLTNVKDTYCFNFLVSIISLIIILALIIREKIKIKGGIR